MKSTGDNEGGDVKQFGSLRFVKSRWLVKDDSCEIPDDARLELSVENDRLKVTVKNAQYGEDYYIWFPYEKNPLTTGDDNTALIPTLPLRTKRGSCPASGALTAKNGSKSATI